LALLLHSFLSIVFQKPNDRKGGIKMYPIIKKTCLTMIFTVICSGGTQAALMSNADSTLSIKVREIALIDIKVNPINQISDKNGDPPI
jgi:hypothetical protein